MIGIDELETLMLCDECEHLEFKEAKNSFEYARVAEYCAALANEGGGRLILGVTDKKPRRVVGSKAFLKPGRTKAGLARDLGLRVVLDELAHPNGRVLVFTVPSHFSGLPVHYKGRYRMRNDEELVDLQPDQLRRILDEHVLDYSAEECEGAGLSDLDPAALLRLRELWQQKSGLSDLAKISDEQLLADLELAREGRVTLAALILLGRSDSLSRLLPQNEVIFEYRSSEASLGYSKRVEYRRGLLGFLDELWSEVNLRNDVQQLQDGLFVREIPTFAEAVVREAILNAVTHREYRDVRSVFVRQFPSKIEVVSPGGFPAGITQDNVLWSQNPRNRRLAETLSKCGFVERSGQGVRRMFVESIREGKDRPEYSGTDADQVFLTIHGKVLDPKFIRFLESVGQETLSSFTIEDFLILDRAKRGETIERRFMSAARSLADKGVLEAVNGGRRGRFILSQRYYRLTGQKGVYTRRKGLDRKAAKLLLLQHIHDNADEGSKFEEFRDVLPSLSPGELKSLVQQLRTEGKIRCLGKTRAGRWFPA